MFQVLKFKYEIDKNIKNNNQNMKFDDEIKKITVDLRNGILKMKETKKEAQRLNQYSQNITSKK